MSGFVFNCPNCGQMSSGSEEDVGVESKCPSCGCVFVLEVQPEDASRCPNIFMCYVGIFRRYFDFKRRMKRREFWWAFVFWWATYILAVVVDFMICGSVSWCAVVFSCVTIIPLAAAHVRRLHDTNKSGWWLPLILLCPINIAYFVWLATKGDRGLNRFGVEPNGKN